jgi:hypothetical protein
MKQIIIQNQQHLLKTNQEGRVPVKKSVKTLSNRKYTAEDLMGLSWVLFEERR